MLTNPHASNCKVITDPVEVEAYLNELEPNLNESIFREANLRGYEARQEATPAHAPTAAGTYHWHAFIPALRTSLIVKGWHKKDFKNCPMIVSPSKDIMIIVMTGNIDTGKEFGDPSNQASKGAVVDNAVAINQQYELFENAALSKLKKGISGTQLWVLLYHVEKSKSGDKEIRAELSLPSKFKNKKIMDWATRLIFKPIILDPGVLIEKPKPTPPIDIPIERRL
ncbi:hypothetical protein [Methylophilus sp. 5]|uniref:hypothetical protein n=1 Tax=Methylophilus sp. 5 TaxID=1112274 RepID=UPI000687FBCC|nr:hypothetical protein [Methylophilus sp. 5]